MFVKARLVGRASRVGVISNYDDYVPVVDKAVDVGWKEKQALTQNIYGSTGWCTWCIFVISLSASVDSTTIINSICYYCLLYTRKSFLTEG